MPRISMWWHWEVLGHRNRTGGQLVAQAGAICQCGKRWTWKVGTDG